jgi:hypothetical protein
MSRVLTLPLRANIPAEFAHTMEIWPISRSKGPDRALSPFFLGPCYAPDGTEFHNMENLWQYSKVYPQLGHIHEDGPKRGMPNERWREWRAEGAASVEAHRYPAGRGRVPAYSYWDGHCLSYVVARKFIYIPEYAKLALATDRFKELRADYKRGERIVIRDFDAYSIWKSSTSLIDVFSSQRRAGHGFVLAAMLEHGPRFYKKLIL